MTALTTAPDLIIRHVVHGGHHLRDFLPGNDNRRAVAHSVASKHEWCGGGIWGRVTPDGIGEWSGSAGCLTAKPRAALLFLTWAEVLEVIASGCHDGHREAYEDAFRTWSAQADASGPAGGWSADPTILHQAEKALIRHGAEHAQVQEVLF